MARAASAAYAAALGRWRVAVTAGLLLHLGVAAATGAGVQVLTGEPVYDAARAQTRSEVRLENTSGRAVEAPVRLVVEAISTAGVSLASPDGYTPQGEPYLDLSATLSEGVLEPGEVSAARPVRFHNPNRLRFQFQTRVWAAGPAATGAAAPAVQGRAALVGQVRDVASGKALPGARVEVTVAGAGGGPRRHKDTTDTDAAGRYQLIVPPGRVGVRVEAPGYTEGYRDLALAKGGAERVPDVYLQPTEPVEGLDPSLGATVEVSGTELVVAIPAGALAIGEGLTATALTPQALPAPLPPGWSPVSAVHLGPDDQRPQGPLTVQLPLRDQHVPVVARWSPARRAWIRMAVSDADAAGRAMLELERLGTLAVVVPDREPSSPPEPAPGEPLPGVSLPPIPAGHQALLSADPASLVPGSGQRLQLRLRLDDGPPLASGTRAEAVVRVRTAATASAPAFIESWSQDVILHRREQALTATLVLNVAAEQVDAGQVHGDVTVELHRPPQGTAIALIGADGGRVAGPAGALLALPPSSLPGPAVVGVRRLTQLPETDAGAGYEFVAGIELRGLGRLRQAAHLSLAWPQSPEPTLVAVRAIRVEGQREYEVVGAVEHRDGRLEIEDGGSLAQGVDGSGHYYLVALKGAIGYVTGQLHSPVGLSGRGALVRGSRLPFVDRVHGDRPRYALPAPAGAAAVHAQDLGTGHDATAVTALPDQGTVSLGLTLTPSVPRVVALEPADGADGIERDAVVELRFSSPMGRDASGPRRMRIHCDGQPLAAVVQLAPDATHAVIRPKRLLPGDARCVLSLGPGLRDRFGTPLQGNRADGSFRASFRTVDTRPPQLPEAGQIQVTAPQEGTAVVTGGRGSAEPGAVVAIHNTATGTLSTVLAETDGSFALRLEAALTDDLELRIQDAAGNVSVQSLGRAEPPPGIAVVGEDGAMVEAADGTAARIPRDALAPDTVVKAEPIATEGLAVPFSEDLRGQVAAAMRVDLGGAELPDVAELRLEVAGLPQYAVVDRVPLFRIEREITVPADAEPGSRLAVRLKGQDAAGGHTRLEAELTVVAEDPTGEPRTLTSEGSPTLRLTLTPEATPGSRVTVTAAADPPNIKLRVPAPATLSGKEQFLVFAVREQEGRSYWDLMDIATPTQGEDGRRYLETASPPYRGLRKDTSRVVVAMFAQASVAYAQVMSNVTAMPANATEGLYAVTDSLSELAGIVEMGVSLASQVGHLSRPDRNLYEFSVVPVKAGVPTTLRIVDPQTQREVYRRELEALPPGSFSSVLVIGEDENDLMVMATTSQANHAVPVDAGISVAFSHLIDTATVTPENLYIQAEGGGRVETDLRLREPPPGKPGEPFAVLVKPRQLLEGGQRYQLIARAGGIRRPGGQGEQGRALQQDFVLPFRTEPPPEVVGRIELPGAKTFDVVGGTALVTQRDVPAGINRFVTVALGDPARPKVLKALDFDVNKAGPLWAVKGVEDAHFKGWDGLAVEGDLALLTMGNSGTFGTLRAFDVDDPAAPEWLSSSMVSIPLDVWQDTAKLVVTPVFDPYSGSLEDIEVRDALGLNLEGIPKTTAYPYTIDVADTRDGGAPFAYFVNQGIGLMTIDLGRAIPPPPVPRRGEKFGPSYIPEDKVGAIVVRDDPSLREASPHFAITAPAHLSTHGERVTVSGTIAEPQLTRLLINGFAAEIDRDSQGRPLGFRVELPLREGVNEVLASAFGPEGEPLGQGRMLLLRDYAENPLAGPGTVRINLKPLQVATEQAIEVAVGVDRPAFFDELLVNGQSASRKRCSPYASQSRSACGWAGEGVASVELRPGINTIVATAIDVDEEFPRGRTYADLRVSEGLALAVKDDLEVFEAGGLVPMARVPIGSAFRVSLAPRVTVDVDGDGRTGLAENDDDDPVTAFEEVKNLALVGERGQGRLTFVDLTEPHKAKVLGRMPAPGPVFRAAVLPGEDAALITAGDALLRVDLRRAGHDGLLDRDGDGRDDRILYAIPLEGAQDVRLDRAKGMAYVLQREIGLAILRLGGCAQDVGVDLSYTPLPRKVRFATRLEERSDLLQGLQAGLAKGACQAFKPNQDFALLSQGSSACIWEDPLRCSAAYQPGLSDYDFELIVADARLDEARQCTPLIEDAIHTVPSLKDAEVSVFAVPRSVFDTAYRAVTPRAGEDGRPTCGSGGDAYGDLCLGRNGLILKWVLEGEWVRDGKLVYNAGIDLEEVLADLGRPIYPPDHPDYDDHSKRLVEPKTGTLGPILKRGAEPEVSHVPRLEGREWACLGDFALNQSGARVRIKGAGLGDVPIQAPYYIKKLHKAAKAGIRTVLGKLLAFPAGQALVFASGRADYRGPQGCLTATADPAGVSGPSDFEEKPCESFEEYIASSAIRAVTARIQTAAGDPLLGEDEAMLAYRMFRFKSDVGPQIPAERAANTFLIDVMAFIESVREDPRINGVHDRTLTGFEDAVERGKNYRRCQSIYLPDYKPEKGGKRLELKVPARLYNGGFRGLADVALALYHDGEPQTRYTAELAPGGSRFYPHTRPDGREEAFKVKVKWPGAHSVSLVADPGDRLTEYDKRNNHDGFHYYVLYPHDAADPPEVADRPEPPVKLPDPPASPICLVDGEAPPSPELQLITTVDGQYRAAVPPGAQVDLGWVLHNRGNTDLRGIAILDSLAGEARGADLGAGESRTVPGRYTAPTEEGPVLGLSTVQALGAEDTGVGPVSSLVKLTVARPRGALAVTIFSPAQQAPPYTTQAERMPVWGLVESQKPLKAVTVAGQAATVQALIPGHYLFETPRGGEAVLKPRGETVIRVLAEDGDGAAGEASVTVRRELPDGPLRVVKRVRSSELTRPHERVRARPGETVTYTVTVTNAGSEALGRVMVTDLELMRQGPGFPTRPPFTLAPGASRTIDYGYRLPTDATSGLLRNAVQAAAVDPRGLPVRPAWDRAEVLVRAPPRGQGPPGGIVLDPSIILLGKPTEDRPAMRELTVWRDDGANVTRDPDTEYRTLDQLLKLPKELGLTSRLAARVNELLKTYHLDSLGGIAEVRVPPVATLEVDKATGRLIAKSPGYSVVQAVHERDGQYLYSNYVLVIAGIAGVGEIDIQPRSLLSVGPQAGVYFTNLLAQNLKKDPTYRLINPNVPMLLGVSGPVCGREGEWGPYLSDWIGTTGFAELASIKLEFLGGLIRGVDVLAAARELVSLIPPVTVPVGPVPVPVPVGWLLSQLLGPAATQLVDFTAEGAVSVRSSFPSGLVSAKASGMGKVTGTLDLSGWGLGKAKDDMLVLVGPRLVSTEVRPDPVLLARAGEEARVQGFATLRLGPKAGEGKAWAVTLPTGADVIDYATDSKLGSYLDKLVPGGLPAQPFRGERELVPLPDRPGALDAVSLRFRLALTEKELVLKDLELGFPAPNFVHEYRPMVDDRGRENPGVAQLLETSGVGGGMGISRRVQGKASGKVHLGVETCFRFMGRARSDHYDPGTGEGGALISVSLGPSAEDLRLKTHMNTPLKLAVRGAPSSVPLTFSLAGGPEHGQVAGLTPPVTSRLGLAGATYTPARRYVGEDRFRYQVADPKGRQAQAQVVVQVENQVPSAQGQTLGPLRRNQPVRGELVAEDPDGDALLMAVGADPSHGRVQLGALTQQGKRAVRPFTYRPEKDYSGEDRFDFRASEAQGPGVAQATVVLKVNHPPRCEDLAAARPLPSRGVTALILKGTDEDRQALSFHILQGPGQGSAELGRVSHQGKASTASLRYRPDPQARDQDRLRFAVSDGLEQSGPCTVTVAMNRPPVATSQRVVVQENQSATLVLAGMDDGQAPLRFRVPDQTREAGALKVLQRLGPRRQAVRYTPAKGYTGRDGFAFQVSDGVEDARLPGIVAIKVNDCPEAVDDAAGTDEGQAVSIDVLANDRDSDPEGPAPHLQVVKVGAVPEAWGQARLVALEAGPPQVSFTPAAGRAGQVSFGYTVADDDGCRDDATVTVTVRPVNRPPRVQDDVLQTPEDTPATADLLANDADPDGDPLTVKAVTQPAHGRVVNQGARIRYTPEADWHGDDGFNYTVDDGQGGAAEARVKVMVTPVNDPPVAGDDAASTDEDQAVAVAVLANDSDVDGDTLEVGPYTQGGQGKVSLDGSALRYVPDPDSHGEDRFQYQADDGEDRSAAATVVITVRPLPDDPKARDDAAATDEDVPVSLAVLANDSDPDGDTLTVQSHTQGAHGRVERAGDALRYVPEADFNGSDAFAYTVGDGTGRRDDASVEVSVRRRPDPPEARDDAAETEEDVPVTIPVLANDTDPDGDALTLRSVTQGGHGHVAGLGGAARYTPEPDWFGTDRFSYWAEDGSGRDGQGQVQVVVRPVNDPPVLKARAVSQACCLARSIPVLEGASDVDGTVDPATLAVVKAPDHGSAEPARGAVRYRPPLFFLGKASFQVQVQDEAGAASEPATVAVDVYNRGAYLNEWVPGEAKVEITNPTGHTVDLSGWQLAGQALDGDPLPRGGFRVVQLLAAPSGPIELRDANGKLLESLDPNKPCYALRGSERIALSRIVDGLETGDPCTGLHWVARQTLGAANP